MDFKGYIDIGLILNTHGLKGELKVKPLTDNPERFSSLKRVYVESDGVLASHDVTNARYFRNVVILKLKEINTVDDAQTLKGLYLMIDRKNAVSLPEDTYFICDIVGCPVYDSVRGFIGNVTCVIQTGSNDVYVVKDSSGEEILVPALKKVVTSISIEERRITVELPEGLVEDEI